MQSAQEKVTQAEALLAQGDLGQAAQLCQQALYENAQNADAYNLLGVISYHVGKADSAKNYFAKAIEYRHDKAGYFINFARVLMDEGNHTLAKGQLERALTIQHDHAYAHALIAECYLQLKDYPSALLHCQKAAELEPANPKVQTVSGKMLLCMGQPDKAQKAFERSLQLLPQNNPDALSGLAEAHQRQDRYKEAETYFEQALALNPSYEVMVKYATFCELARKYDKAIRLFEKAAEIKPQEIEPLFGMATASAHAGEYEKSIAIYKEILAVHPSMPHKVRLTLYENLATLYEKMNLLEECEAALGEAEALEEDHPPILKVRAMLARRRGEMEKAEVMLRKAAETYGDSMDERVSKSKIYAELGQVLQKQKRYDEAFEAFESAQAISAAVSQIRGISTQFFNTVIGGSAAFFTPENVAQFSEAHINDNTFATPPVFLIGFPRSGTTLTEQVLAAHPDVLAMQEEPAMLKTIMATPHLLNRHIEYPNYLAQVTAEEMEKLRVFYREECKNILAQDTAGKTVVDKHPLTIQYLGFISRAMPEAKIIMLIRDPRDVCLSCFCQTFETNSAMASFFTLESTIKTYARVLDLYAQLKEVLPLNILEIRYEDMVQDIEGYSRRMLEFLDLPWHDDVLHYYAKDKNRYVSTPSYEGVMKPVYTSSIGKWKHYHKQFAPHMDTLRPYLDAYGYAE